MEETCTCCLHQSEGSVRVTVRRVHGVRMQVLVPSAAALSWPGLMYEVTAVWLPQQTDADAVLTAVAAGVAETCTCCLHQPGGSVRVTVSGVRIQPLGPSAAAVSCSAALRSSSRCVLGLTSKGSCPG